MNRHAQNMPRLLLSPLLLLAASSGPADARFFSSVASRRLSDDTPAPSATVIRLGKSPSPPQNHTTEPAKACEQTYGFLPCTTTVFRNLFLSVAYGFLMYKAATYLSDGSELLLEILGTSCDVSTFVPAVGGEDDEGYVMCFVPDEKTWESEMLIIDGKTMSVVTTIGLPSRVPYGFHGEFMSSDELTLQL